MKPFRKCETIEIEVTPPPLFPENQSATAVPEGNTCNLEWDRVCSSEEGPFENCDYPAGYELSGYYIVRVMAPSGKCSDVTVPDNPVMNDPIGRGIVEANPSFTDTALSNNTTYCYRVFGYNMVNAFSRNTPIPDPVQCTPMDIHSAWSASTGITNELYREFLLSGVVP